MVLIYQGSSVYNSSYSYKSQDNSSKLHITDQNIAIAMPLRITNVAVLLWTVQLVAAQQKACSSFCSSLGMVQSNPGLSCNDIYQINKGSRGMSDNYWINTTMGVHQVYCDMELECGGHKGGWMRIADLDISRGDDCPTGWTKTTTANDGMNPATDVCRSPNDNAGCHSTSFTVNGTSYHKVCGKVRGYISEVYN